MKILVREEMRAKFFAKQSFNILKLKQQYQGDKSMKAKFILDNSLFCQHLHQVYQSFSNDVQGEIKINNWIVTKINEKKIEYK